MFEKVNPSHPDKLADRIAGAIIDLAYTKNDNPKVAVEVLIGHQKCHIIIETSEEFNKYEIDKIVKRIAGDVTLDLEVVKQDIHLSNNQEGSIRCGDNGISYKDIVEEAREYIKEIGGFEELAEWELV